MKVTRIAYSKNLNAGKYEQLTEQARRLGRVRSEVWRRYGSVNGVGLSDRKIRDAWMVDGTAERFVVLANAWKETVRDAIADITANRAAAKAAIRQAVRRTSDPAERRRLFTALKRDTWTEDLHCARCGVVWQADHAAATNILHRVDDPDITPHTPYQRVKRIVQERTDRRPDQTADPGLQPTLPAESETSERSALINK